jgi:carbonic anhydrase
VVFGHAHCAGIEAMINGQQGNTGSGRFIQAWTAIAAQAFHRAKAINPAIKDAELARCCERQAVLVSLENLMTFPFVREKVNAGTLEIHGWYLDIGEGHLWGYDPVKRTFEPLD